MGLFNFFKNGRQKDSKKSKKKVTIEKHRDGSNTIREWHENGQLSLETKIAIKKGDVKIRCWDEDGLSVIM